MRGSRLPPHAQQALVRTARRVVELVVASLTGIDAGTAQHNAWEATCADLQRRQIGIDPDDAQPPA
jgi:hypothetical protein